MVSFLRLQSPTVVSLFHCLKFGFLADSSASLWPKLFLLLLERQERQHFFPKAAADLGQFYIPRVLQPANFALYLTRVTWEQIFPFSCVLVPSLVPSAVCTQCVFPSFLLCYQMCPFPCVGLNQGILATICKQGMSTCLAQAPGETGLRWRLGRRTALLLSWHRVRKICSCWLLCFLNLLDDVAIDLVLCWDDLNSGMVEGR